METGIWDELNFYLCVDKVASSKIFRRTEKTPGGEALSGSSRLLLGRWHDVHVLRQTMP